MVKKRVRLIMDVEPDLLAALRETGKAGDMSPGRLAVMLLEQSRPALSNLAQVFTAAKLQQMEAFDHLQAMTSSATAQLGQYGLSLVESRRKAEVASASQGKKRRRGARKT